MKTARSVLIIGILALLLPGSSASAKDTLEMDILQLQHDMVTVQSRVKDLQDSFSAKNAAMVTQIEKVADQVNNLTDGLRKLNDLIGTVRSDNATANAAAAANTAKSASETRDALAPLMNALGDIQKSINSLKEAQTANGTQLKSLSDQLIAMKSSSEPAPTCKDFKQAADRSANSGYWEDAIGGGRQFLADPICAKDPKAADVQLLIADSFYNSKKFDQAIVDYDIFLKNYPGHDKYSGALLREGLAYAELKNIAGAKTAFTRVTKEFPGTSDAISAAAKLKELNTPAAGRGRGN